MIANDRLVKTGFLGLRSRGTGLLLPEEPGARDERNLDYPIATAVAPQPEMAKRWDEGPQLDQGREGACVGFGFTSELMAEPFANREVTVDVAEEYARSHWRRAQFLGTGNAIIDPNKGASMSSGAKVAVERGFFESYLWAQNIEDVRNAVIAEGPVVMATKMFNGVSQPTQHGVIEPDLDDTDAPSAHCMTIVGYDPARRTVVRGVESTYRMFFIRNSWGRNWNEVWGDKRVWKPGKKGKPGKWVTRMKITREGGAWITALDLEYLLREYGWGFSACLPVGRRTVDLGAALAAHQDHTLP